MDKFRVSFFVLILFNANTSPISANCGCKEVRKCYSDMIYDLRANDEASCISDAAIGASTVTIFLKAISKYCTNITELLSEKLTYEKRNLYEMIISTPLNSDKEDERPVFVVDAGQEAGTESVGFALYLIEQLVSCEENNEMITKVRWVIMPSTNPDGQEYARFNREQWKKNMKPAEEASSYGVDISRNFEGEWKACPKVQSSFSSIYPGPSAASENETQFVQSVLNKYRKNAKMYISLRRDGHSISYPHGYDSAYAVSRPKLEKVAGIVAAKVNQRAGSVYHFTNQTIFELNNKPHCGHSVDYAHQLLSIPYTFEMRVFLGSENKMMNHFQQLPRGYETTLRNSYFSGFREMYTLITKDNQYKFF